jgi:hypothetical protein
VQEKDQEKPDVSKRGEINAPFSSPQVIIKGESPEGTLRLSPIKRGANDGEE